MKYKRTISMILALTFLFSISIFADDNVDTGEGGARPAIVAKYRTAEWLYKGSIYVGLSDNAVPRIPITHDGNLNNNVKSFFGDTGTLLKQINKIAETYGTGKENLASNITFNIGEATGKFLPEDILPFKNPETGKYQNLVPWVIIYEPVIIAHLRDEQTRIAFTATEYAFNSYSRSKDI